MPRKERYTPYELLSAEELESKREAQRKYLRENRSEVSRKHREYRRKNPDIMRAIKHRQIAKLKQETPEIYIWREIKRRAKKNNLPFDIQPSDIKVPNCCPILGINLEFGIKKSSDCSPSVDRVIPSKGYVKGNCFIISNKANRMKQDNTLEDFEKIISYIKERIKVD